MGTHSSHARALTFMWLLSSAVSILMLPMIGVIRERELLLQLIGVVTVAAFFVAHVVMMWSALTPWVSPAVNSRNQIVFVVLGVLSLPLVGPVAAGQWPTWAWLGAAIVGVSPLIWRWPTAVAVSALATLASVGVALLWEGDWLQSTIITAGMGAGLAIFNWTPVWLWELLARSEASQATHGQLAAAEERHRFARDVHDILGHDLTVIALKAELVARTAMKDPAAAARVGAELRQQAESALDRVRSAAAGYRATDVNAEIEAMAELLRSAGIGVDVDATAVDLTSRQSEALSAVLKEAATNVLRHSGARICTMRLAADDGLVSFAMTNDGVRVRHSPADRRGAGLDGMRARLAPLGGDASWGAVDNTFSLHVHLPVAP